MADKFSIMESSKPKGALPEEEQDFSYKLRKAVRQPFEATEKYLTEDGDETSSLNKVLADVVGSVKDVIPDPEKDTQVSMGMMPAPRMLSSAFRTAEKAVEKAAPRIASSAIKETGKAMAKVPEEVLQNIDKLPEKEIARAFNKFRQLITESGGKDPKVAWNKNSFSQKTAMKNAGYDPVSGNIHNPSFFTPKAQPEVLEGLSNTWKAANKVP